LIYLLRHGQTHYNAERRIQGQCDSELTDLGREQARAMGRALREHVAPDVRIVCSPLGRTVASAELVREAAGIVTPLETDPLLKEIGCGSWENRLHEECRAATPHDPSLSFTDFWRHHCPDGESYYAARGRAVRWLEQHDGKRVVAVAHGVIGKLIRGHYLGLAYGEMDALPSPQDRLFRLHEGKAEEILAS
jgi:broad specificity phosphatase PhoE